MADYYFIVNPHSRTGHGLKIWRTQLYPYLRSVPFSWKVFFTRYSGHCTQIVSQLTKNLKKPVTIVICGGDGTLNEAVNGLAHMELATLAYIPTGSGNDFARSLKLTGTPIQMLRSILQKKRELLLDYGIVRAPGKAPRRFIVSSGCGFDAAITDEALHSRIKSVLNRLGLGKLTYMIIAIRQMIRHRFKRATIILDGRKVLHLKKYLFASAHIQPYEGGGFAFAPSANPSDGLLDLCIVHHLPKFKAICILPMALAGKHTGFNGINIFSCRSARIILNEPARVHTDGETYHPRKEVEFTCQQQKIHFVC